MNPFNIDILILNKDILKTIGQVTNLAIIESTTKNFTRDGLFSTEIFGLVGSPERSTTFGYIDLKYPILHPLVYQHITTLKSFYKDIMLGKKYAKWDNKLKDLVPSDSEDGETGYEFMLTHIHKIDLKDNGSDERSFKIKMVKKYTDEKMMIKDWVVMPAGLRDYYVEEDGTPKEDEINDLYRKLLATVNTLNNIKVTKETISTLDPIRIKIQNIILEIYEYIKVMLDGKSKFIQGKWSKRAITYGTRNVITSVPTVITDLDSNDVAGFNDTVIGLYQYIAAISPEFKYRLDITFINRLFDRESNVATLVDKKSLTTVNVEIDPTKRDEWTSEEGILNLISKFGQESNRSLPIVVDGYYLLLIYDNGKKIVPIFNTETDMEDLDKKYIRPITYAELYYISIYEIKNKYPAYLTRYPVVDIGGIYPTKLYVKTTINSRTIKCILNGVETEMVEYPILKESYYNALSPNPSKLGRLVGDYDGDTVSLNILLADESIAEIDNYINSKAFYITPNGELAHSVDIDPLNLVLKHLTKD